MNGRTVLSSSTLAPPPRQMKDERRKSHIEEINTSPNKSVVSAAHFQAHQPVLHQSISIINPSSSPLLQSPVPTPVIESDSSSARPHYLPPKQALGSILASNLNISTNISTNMNANRLIPVIGSPLNGQTSPIPTSPLKNSIIKQCASNDNNNDNNNDDSDDSSDDSGIDKITTAMSTADFSCLTVEKPSAALIAKSQSPLWLPSYLHRALSLGLVPRLHSADAGTSSAAIFTDKLLEDTFIVRTDCDEIKRFNLRGFEGFLRNVIITASTEL